MKLITIIDAQVKGNAYRYAQEEKLTMIEVTARKETPLVLNMIQQCIDELYQKGCSEFCFKEIRDRYNIMEDTHSWQVTLFGFVKAKEDT